MPTKGKKSKKLRLAQFWISPTGYRKAQAMAKRADKTFSAFLRSLIEMHEVVEGELAEKARADKAATERMLIERARMATPDAFALPVDATPAERAENEAALALHDDGIGAEKAA